MCNSPARAGRDCHFMRVSLMVRLLLRSLYSNAIQSGQGSYRIEYVLSTYCDARIYEFCLPDFTIQSGAMHLRLSELNGKVSNRYRTLLAGNYKGGRKLPGMNGEYLRRTGAAANDDDFQDYLEVPRRAQIARKQNV